MRIGRHAGSRRRSREGGVDGKPGRYRPAGVGQFPITVRLPMNSSGPPHRRASAGRRAHTRRARTLEDGATGCRRSRPASGRNSPRQVRSIVHPVAQGPVEASALPLGKRNGNRKHRADHGADDRKHDEGIHDARSRRRFRAAGSGFREFGRRFGDTNPAGNGAIASCFRCQNAPYRLLNKNCVSACPV